VLFTFFLYQRRCRRGRARACLCLTDRHSCLYNFCMLRMALLAQA